MASTPVVQVDVFGDDAAMGVAGYNFGMPASIKPPSAAIDAAGKAYGVPVIANYEAILGLPAWRQHMDSTCVYPDEALDAVKAQQKEAVIAPLVKNLIWE